MNLLRKIGVIALLLLLSMGVSAQVASVAEKEMTVAERNAAQGFNDTIDRLDPNFVTVSLVIADPGDILYSSFGHAMLHLECPVFHLDYIFSYESEGISNNWGRFLKGNLKMGMFAIDPDTVYAPYRAEGRGVKEYKLNLSPTQKQELWRIMDELAAIGPNQPYDYYTRGCAISVVHVIKRALQGQNIEYSLWPEKFNGTLRELGYECVTKAHRPWNRFALMTLAGSGIDNPTISKERKLIVPADLVEIWQKAKIDGKPLLEREPTVKVESTIVDEPKWWISPLALSLLVLLLAFVPWRAFDYMVLAIVTFIGVMVCYTVCLSSLPCTSWNWLIIPFNILPALAWHWRRYWSLPYAGIIVVWCIGMLSAPHRLVEYAHIILALAFCVVLIKQSSLLLTLHSKK